MSDIWFIPPSDFLARMEPREREALLALAEPQSCRRHGFVFQAGSAGENVYVLLSGRIKIFQLSPVGREIIQWFCFPGEVFGLAEMPRGGRREVYAQACADSEVLSIPKERFRSFLIESPSTAMLVIDLLSCRLRTLGDMLLNLTADDVMSRVIKLLTRLAARYGKRVDADFRLDIDLTHQEMADMIGTSRQTVTSALGSLKRRGILRVQNHAIYIQKPELLEHMLDTVPDPAHRAADGSGLLLARD